MATMEPTPERRGQVTTQGYTLYIEEYDGRKTAYFLDPQRSYVRVAKVNVPIKVRDNPKKLDEFYRRVHRRILDAYRTQHVQQALGLVLFPEARLSAEEMERFLKQVSAVFARSLADTMLPDEPPPSKRRKPPSKER